jgi:hypothetical protein
MFIHLETVAPNCLIGRGYDQVDGYELQMPFRLVFTGLILSATKVYLCAGMHRDHNDLDLSDMRDIAIALIAAGYTHADVLRHRRKKIWDLRRLLLAN